jgi:hypothetical protein
MKEYHKIRSIFKRDENTHKFIIGDKVTYIGITKKEHGIIKSMCDDGRHCFVVYNCNGEWYKYIDYTAIKTNKSDLTNGWQG